MKIHSFFEKISLPESISDCELVSVTYNNESLFLTLEIKAVSDISSSDLLKCEGDIKNHLKLSRVRIIRHIEKVYTKGTSIKNSFAQFISDSKTPDPESTATPFPEPPPESPPAEPYGYESTSFRERAVPANVHPMNSLPPVASSKRKAYTENTKAHEGKVIMGKKISAFVTSMENAPSQGGIVLRGDVFDKTSRTFRGKDGRPDKVVTVISFTDKTSSAIIKLFTSAKKNIEAMNKIKKGMSILVEGELSYDEYEKTDIIKPTSIMEVEPIKHLDEYEGDKRIELHLHTKMSDMDATNTAAEYVNLAYKWGHKAVAITDHGNIQAYPEVMNAYEKIKKNDPETDFKVIYGMEAYFVNDGKPLLPNGWLPFSGEFIVFDLETTGLTPADCRITEIGAVKLRGMEIVEQFKTFINPEMPIPSHITEITGITDDMVRNAPFEKEAFEDFISFCGGTSAALVAHNASFDTSFLKSGFNRCGLEYNFMSIDTLTLSRAAAPNLKKHKLDIMVKHYELGEFNHHRALDDAKITALLFKRIVEDAGKGRVMERISDLNNVFGGTDIKKDKYYHMIILVKNKTGLKNLYKLVSYSNLYYFYKKPRIPLSELSKHREGLIIGSACEQGELFRAVLDGRPESELIQIADLYDFLEIQPIGNNAFLLRNGDVSSETNLQLLNKRIYDLAIKLNKPVVATGDVHFMNSDDSIFREILQTGQGFKDASNQAPLFFRTTSEMLAEFEYLGEDKAREVVIDFPQKVADMIEPSDNVRPIPKGEYRPFIEGAEEELKTLCHDNARRLYGDNLDKVIVDRMNKELDSIINNGFSVLYVIAQKLVKRSEEDGYTVGSRGSVGSSVAAFLSGISEVNPLPPHYRCPKCRHTEFEGFQNVGSGFDLPEKACPDCNEIMVGDGHDIPFETFLGFKGDKVPDIDLNFSGEYQAKAHEYAEELLGKGNVFKAGTISAVKDKTAYGFVMKFADERGIKLSSAEINRLVAGVEGVKRTTSQHPGGMIVVPMEYEVYDFTPIQHPAEKTEGKMITTHFDFHALHDTITKLDMLGHDAPTMYKHLSDMTGIKFADVPTSDKAVMRLFTSSEPLNLSFNDPLFPTGTYGLPEMGTPFVTQMLREAKPKTFADLLQISGLSHGTDVWLGNAQELIKSGTLTISEVIGTRDNIMVYLMKKGMDPSLAFKITEITRKGKAAELFDDEIYAAFKAHDVDDWYVESCKKIKYMFPKAHAAAYVMGAVKLGWYKINYPKEFYAAALMRHTENIDVHCVVKGKDAVKKRLTEIEALPKKTPKEQATYNALLMVYEMQLRGINLLGANYKTSHPTRYIIDPESESLYLPYSAIGGCGENAARRLYEVIQSGDFICIDDIQSKSGLNKTVLETLIKTRFFGDLPQTSQISLFDM